MTGVVRYAIVTFKVKVTVHLYELCLPHHLLSHHALTIFVSITAHHRLSRQLMVRSQFLSLQNWLIIVIFH